MRAIVSVSDKMGVTELVEQLVRLGVEVFSTGGTKRAIEQAGLPVRSISELTGFPEILDGRVKTLHPAVHSGILARREIPAHVSQMTSLGLSFIDIVIVNLYPFVRTVSQADVSLEDALENIDIGGPTMVRAAAKNFPNVLVMVDPADYRQVLGELEGGLVSLETRRRLAAKAFQHTAAYDTYISSYLRDEAEIFPPMLTLVLSKQGSLQYGENPHQQAAVYCDALVMDGAGTILGAQQLSGKKRSFVDTLDANLALRCVRGYNSAAVAIVKHGSPCGLACGDGLLVAYQKAWGADPATASGAAIAFNREVDLAVAERLAETYFEDIVAPQYAPGALDLLRQKNAQRVFQVDLASPETGKSIGSVSALDWRRVSGGFLAQTPDLSEPDEPGFKVVSRREPTLDELTNMLFAWRSVKYVRSCAAVVASNLALVGVGAGQMNRLDSLRLALTKAGRRSLGGVLACDAFMQRADEIELVVAHGVTAVVQPGGSTRDMEILSMADKHHLAMVFTDRRHYLH